MLTMKIHWLFILLNVLAGLVIFLFGISNVSEGLKNIASDRIKDLIGKSTKNIFIAILTGIFATTILNSSSVVIIILIVMVNTELLSSRQSYGIVLGSNIGTTIGSQLFAFDMGEYAAIPMLIGFALMIVFKQEKVKQVGKSILGLGLVYFGLYHIGESVSPLKELPSFTALMLQFVNPLKGALSGAIATLIIQSSSATVGILLSFAKQKLITLPAAVAVILGSEIGTCSDTLIASIGRSRAAIRTGVFHLFFNVTAVIIGLSLFKPFITFVDFISGNSSLARHIANAHMLFNVLSVLLFIAFVPLISMLLDKVIADKLTK